MILSGIKSHHKRFTSETHEKWKKHREAKSLKDATVDTIKQGQHDETYDKNYKEKKSLKKT